LKKEENGKAYLKPEEGEEEVMWKGSNERDFI
jgi:hypothetical protein